jgi:hypothetical protein
MLGQKWFSAILPIHAPKYDTGNQFSAQPPVELQPAYDIAPHRSNLK